MVACTLFAAICGSSVATALAMGTILIPAMIERGYPRSFALGVVGASGTIGIVDPAVAGADPYGIVAEQSVPRLFLAGILPGPAAGRRVLRVGSVLRPAAHKLPVEPVHAVRGAIVRVTLNGAAGPARCRWSCMVGIYGGFVTVTEAAALVRRGGAARQPVLLPRFPLDSKP